MTVRLHQALFGGFLAVIGVLTLVLFLVLGGGLRRQLVESVEVDLERQLTMTEALLRATAGRNLDSLATVVARGTGYRVTVIELDGRVIADSDVPLERLPFLENHADRPEVVGALEGRLSFAQRTSATVARPLLYGARVFQLRDRRLVLRVAVSIHEVDRAVSRVRWAVAGAGAIAVFMALLVSFPLTRSLTRPLTDLAGRARELASGDTSRKAPVSRLVEVDQLGSAFNRLSEELRSSVGQLARERDEVRAILDSITEGVVALTSDGRVNQINAAAMRLLDVRDPPPFAPVQALIRHHEIRDLMAIAPVREITPTAVQVGDRHLIVSSRSPEESGTVVTLLDVTDIRRLEQVRRDFVANASHEIKTPLTAIRGYAETLLEDDPPSDVRRQFLESIFKNTRRLQRLVDDLLDLSRLESGGWVARPEPVDVSAVAEEVWDEIAGHDERTAGIQFEIEGSGLSLADEHGLAQIFRNLFDNSVRHTPEGGRLFVRIRTAGERVAVEVTDTGSGIPSASLSRIFERFYRVDPARSRSEGGTGLGLAIVRHLVSAMGGTVRAESMLGQGTTIRFTLPVA